jgi:aryl-alcohol dehydrogenase-like predicted oxidoreductase
MSFYAYSPQAGGFLAKSKEKLLSHNVEGRWDAKDEAGQFFRDLYSRPALLEALDKWEEISSESGIPRAKLAYRWTAFNSQLSDEYDDRIIWSGSSEEQVKQTIAGLNKGPLSANIAKRIDDIWDSVKNDSPLDHFNKDI